MKAIAKAPEMSDLHQEPESFNLSNNPNLIETYPWRNPQSSKSTIGFLDYIRNIGRLNASNAIANVMLASIPTSVRD
jgi:hypothetical protein